MGSASNKQIPDLLLGLSVLLWGQRSSEAAVAEVVVMWANGSL